MNITVVGLGGIGSWLIQGLLPYLAYSSDKLTRVLTLIDGDDYEDQNRSRQVFKEIGPKAAVQAKWIADAFPEIGVQPIPRYLSNDYSDTTCALPEGIGEDSIVFSCVDNHKTRKMIYDHCKTLKNVTVISGGNEFSDGNIQVFIREDGKNRTALPDSYHPELKEPADKAPYELSCDEMAESHPQLIFTNLMVASLMLNAFYSIEQERFDVNKPEVYMDILANAATPRTRRAQVLAKV